MTTHALRVLSLIPPMTQLNTPYPSTAYITGFLRSRGVDAVQADLALALVLQLFTAKGLESVHERALAQPEADRSGSVHAFLDQFTRYRNTIGPVIAFLQGRDSTLAHRIAARELLPEGPRFNALEVYVDPAFGGDEGGDPLAWAFGALGVQDKARHVATLYLNDLADVLRDAVDERFAFVRYAESLASSQPSFDPMAAALAAPFTLVDEVLHALTLATLAAHKPDVVLLSVPFPGALYAALRIAQTIKAVDPKMVIALGGGFVNTELRELNEPRVFDFVDYVTLDAGERPLLSLLEHVQGKRSKQRLVRTFVREAGGPHPDLIPQAGEGVNAPVRNAWLPRPSGERAGVRGTHEEALLSGNSPHPNPLPQAGEGTVRYINFVEPDIGFEDIGTPTWDGLPLDRYLSLLDMLNPMHRLWSDGRWNKLTVAHGCYWKKCSFCDVSLDYISRYETASASTLADRMEAIVNETGQTGFHFVDEAAPPKSLKALAEELLRRQLPVSWWGNIRFEKTFSPELCQLLADSGCIAMSGGLEVASDRLLTLMKKGVSVEQVARVTKGLSDAGILVHAYLMYGFPTQTVQDTVDSLEYVRQLFENGCIQSGFFHRFSCTVHSPVGLDPAAYGIELIPLPEVTFAKNDIGFIDPTGVDHDALGVGLRKAIYNYMHGVGLDEDVRAWFSHLEEPVPRTRVKMHFVARALERGDRA